jgi:hypothetical protein
LCEHEPFGLEQVDGFRGRTRRRNYRSLGQQKPRLVTSAALRERPNPEKQHGLERRRLRRHPRGFIERLADRLVIGFRFRQHGNQPWHCVRRAPASHGPRRGRLALSLEGHYPVGHGIIGHQRVDVVDLVESEVDAVADQAIQNVRVIDPVLPFR